MIWIMGNPSSQRRLRVANARDAQLWPLLSPPSRVANARNTEFMRLLQYFYILELFGSGMLATWWVGMGGASWPEGGGAELALWWAGVRPQATHKLALYASWVLLVMPSRGMRREGGE